jgi:hypothetical protein
MGRVVLASGVGTMSGQLGNEYSQDRLGYTAETGRSLIADSSRSTRPDPPAVVFFSPGNTNAFANDQQNTNPAILSGRGNRSPTNHNTPQVRTTSGSPRGVPGQLVSPVRPMTGSLKFHPPSRRLSRVESDHRCLALGIRTAQADMMSYSEILAACVLYMNLAEGEKLGSLQPLLPSIALALLLDTSAQAESEFPARLAARQLV